MPESGYSAVTSGLTSLISSKKDAESLLPKKDENGAVIRESDKARAADYVKSLADIPADSPIKQGIACFLKYGVKPLIVVAMFYIWIGKKLYFVYKLLPMNLVRMIFGITLCTFGGAYFMTLAAMEAFRIAGGDKLWDDLNVIWEQGGLVAVANTEDDKVDADKDGTADVLQMSTNDLITHKAKMAMTAVSEPDRLMSAVQSLMAAYLAVLATLKFQFAKTVSLALGIADCLALPAVRIFAPLVAMVLGKDLNHWVEPLIVTFVKIIAVVVATYIQAMISAFYSALRGGRMFAENLFALLSENGIMDKLPDSLVAKPWDPNKSYLDEIIMYPVAAAGFYFQISRCGLLISSSCILDFPFDLLLLPLTIVEWILKWQVFT